MGMGKKGCGTRFNSLDTEMLTRIRDALDFDAAPAAVLLTAVEGKAFCAGGDIKHVAALPSPREKVTESARAHSYILS